MAAVARAGLGRVIFPTRIVERAGAAGVDGAAIASRLSVVLVRAGFAVVTQITRRAFGATDKFR